MDRDEQFPESEWLRANDVSNSSVAGLVPKIEFEPVEIADSEITDVVSIFEEMMINGGAVLAVVRITNQPALAYRAASHVDAGAAFYEHLFTSEAFATAAGEMEVGDELLVDLHRAEIEEPTIERLSPYKVDGHLASLLMFGGAYYGFEGGGPDWEEAPSTYGTAADAKRMGEQFVDTAFDYRFSDLDAYRTSEQWCNWFQPPILAWDETLVVIDKRYRLVWILCLTDMD
ncbi:hypothetical protein [Halorussus halophilus]|uniref:hypothetical protein n=1 Tax=Halorussus halophilus TaxID=2650975 RepID=UPI001300EEAE|nr:hypothetical protein [Halorussus halophilus]